MSGPPAFPRVANKSSSRGLLPRLWPLFVAFWLVFLVTGLVALMLEGP